MMSIASVNCDNNTDNNAFNIPSLIAHSVQRSQVSIEYRRYCCYVKSLYYCFVAPKPYRYHYIL